VSRKDSGRGGVADLLRDAALELGEVRGLHDVALGGHGTTIGGIIVDGGKFAWSQNVEKFPGLTEPDPSYHGASYTTAVGDGIAYIIKARVQLLRDLGSSISPRRGSASAASTTTRSRPSASPASGRTRPASRTTRRSSSTP
jgi:hypothetical protein